MLKRTLLGILLMSLFVLPCTGLDVHASSSVGIDLVGNDSGAAPDDIKVSDPSADTASDGPTVINQDQDDYYPGAEVEVVTYDSEAEEEKADDLPEPVEKPVEEPEVTSTEGASTGIPRLDQYTNVDETENTRWRILNDEPSSYTKDFEAYISSGTIRLEVFYTADADMPELTFTSSGGNVYSMTEGSKSLGKTQFKVKNQYSITDYPDIKYSIIYISNAEDPGTWSIKVRLNNRIREFALVTSEIPESWETLDTDYKTRPKELLLWYLSEYGVDITQESSHSFEDMIGIISMDTQIPTTNDIDSTEVVASKKKQNPLSGFFFMLTFLIILGVITVIFILKKLRDQSRGMIANRITRANKRLKEGSGGLNESIDKIMSAGEEISGYFDVSKIPIVPPEHKEMPAPLTVKAVYEPAQPLRYNDDEDFF